MNVPEWLPWLAAGIAIIAWRRVVQGWMRAGRFSPRGAAAVYAAVIPVLVLAAFTWWGRLGIVALVYAAIGFALSYGLALLSFRRLARLG
ncbi:MAG TPA: hypothetical protein VFU99_11640 [Gaiellaceae bacterium]|nr:hypothetical protein [Gaiellaceae bacterium]